MDSPATMTVVVLLVVFALGVALGSWLGRSKPDESTFTPWDEQDAVFGVDGLNWWVTGDVKRMAEVVVTSATIEGCQYPQYSVTLYANENEVSEAKHAYLSNAVDKAIDEAEEQLSGGRYER